MAILDTSFERIKQDLNKPELTVKELEDILFSFGLEVDGVNEDEIKIEITAERSDLLSHQGFIRAIKEYIDLDKSKDYDVKKSHYVVDIDESVKDVRPYTVCAVVKNLVLDDDKLKEIIRAQEKLHITLARKRKIAAIGIYPLEKLEFPIKYCAKPKDEISFVPLGENKEMKASEILKEHPTGISYCSLLDNCDKYPLFIDKNNNILSLPPIINSQTVGSVELNTKDVFIECSGFNLIKLNQIINILCCMFIDFGGEVNSVTLNYNHSDVGKLVTPDLKYTKKVITVEYINKILGTNFDVNKVCELLVKMQYKCKKKFSGDEIEVFVPPFRTDILHNVDIADDVGRAYGFSNIDFKTPTIASFGSLLPSTIKQDNIIRTMTELGYQEVRPLSLSSKKEMFENFNLNEDDCCDDFIQLGYSKDKSLDVVVNWLTPKLFKVLRNNQHMLYPQKIFCCDKVVVKDEAKDVKSITKLKCSCLIANTKISFTDISSTLFTLCNIMGWHLKLEAKNYPFYIKGRSAKILINNQDIGHIGEFDPKVLLNNNYTVPVAGFEIDVSNL